MHATPQNKTVFFCSLYAAALRCINPLFGCINCWRNTVWTLLLEKHCVDSTHIYIYIFVYIYTVYIYMYMYMYMLTPPIPTLKHFLGRIYVVIFVY